MISVTFVMFGFGVYGVLNIRLDYDSIWFIGQNSYQTSYFEAIQKNFPEHGERVEVYVGKYIKRVYYSTYVLYMCIH